MGKEGYNTTEAMASSDSTLASVDRLNIGSGKAVDLQNERHDLTSDGDIESSTRAPSIQDEKQLYDTVTKDEPQDVIEYPKGFTLALIIIAISLTIFLPSLDMVSD